MISPLGQPTLPAQRRLGAVMRSTAPLWLAGHRPLPALLEGRTEFNLEFLPSANFGYSRSGAAWRGGRT